MSSGIAEIQPLSPEKKQVDTNARQEFETTAGEGLRNRKHAPTSDDSGCNLDVSGSSITKKTNRHQLSSSSGHSLWA